MIGGVDTICSQCFGASEFRKIGIFTNIARLVIFLFFVICGVPTLSTAYYVMKAIGQNDLISEISSQYCISMLPGLFFSLQFNISGRYLQAMNIFKPITYTTLATMILHPFWCYLFIDVYNLDVTGAGIAMGITQFLNWIIITIYIEVAKNYPDSIFYYHPEIFTNDNLLMYLKVAIPSAVVITAEWLGFEILSLLASFLGNIELASNVCLYNFLALLFNIPMGISFATTTLVGNSIGSGDSALAKDYTKAALKTGFGIMSIISILLYIFRTDIPKLYTFDEDIIMNVSHLIAIYSCFCLIDTAQHILLGVIKGIGEQTKASIICLIVLYPINIPLAYYLAFICGFGLSGLWYSQFISILILAVSYGIIIAKSDWERLAIEAAQIEEKNL